MFWFAGDVAEEEFFGSEGDGDDDDRLNATAAIMNIAGEDRDAHWRYEQRLLAKTRSLVRRHRTRIEALARAALEEKVMSESRMRSVIGLPPHPPRRCGVTRNDPFALVRS